MSAENGMTTMNWPVLFTTTGNRIITPMKYLEMEKSIERKREKEREERTAVKYIESRHT